MRNPVLRKKPFDFLKDPRGKFITVAASFILFWTALFVLYPKVGLPITTLGILPVLIGARVYGMWPGMFLALGLYCVDVLVIVMMGWDDFEVAILPNALVGLAHQRGGQSDH